jgi:hypothetical protein
MVEWLVSQGFEDHICPCRQGTDFPTIKQFDIGVVVSVHIPTKQVRSQQNSRDTSGIYGTIGEHQRHPQSADSHQASLALVLTKCSVVLCIAQLQKEIIFTHTFHVKKPNPHGTEPNKHWCYLYAVFSHMPHLALHD